MTDDERIKEIRNGLKDCIPGSSYYRDVSCLLHCLDREVSASKIGLMALESVAGAVVEDTERRGMERAAKIAERATGGLALPPAETGKQIAAAIRAEAAKLVKHEET